MSERSPKKIKYSLYCIRRHIWVTGRASQLLHGCCLCGVAVKLADYRYAQLGVKPLISLKKLKICACTESLPESFHSATSIRYSGLNSSAMMGFDMLWSALF